MLSSTFYHLVDDHRKALLRGLVPKNSTCAAVLALDLEDKDDDERLMRHEEKRETSATATAPRLGKKLNSAPGGNFQAYPPLDEDCPTSALRTSLTTERKTQAPSPSGSPKKWQLKHLFRRQNLRTNDDSKLPGDFHDQTNGKLSPKNNGEPIVLRKFPRRVRFKDIESVSSSGFHKPHPGHSDASTSTTSSSPPSKTRNPAKAEDIEKSERYQRLGLLQDMRKRSIYLNRNGSDVSSLGVPGPITVYDVVHELPYMVESFSNDMSTMTHDLLRENFNFRREESCKEDDDSRSELSTFYDGSSFGCNRGNLFNICAALHEECGPIMVCQ